jgi:hypothetical protein
MFIETYGSLDLSGLNAIKLVCRDKTGTDSFVYSGTAAWGTWLGIVRCDDALESLFITYTLESLFITYVLESLFTTYALENLFITYALESLFITYALESLFSFLMHRL